MTLGSTFVINFQVSRSSGNIGMTQLTLDIKQIRPIANRFNRITRPELMRRQVRYPGPLAILPQVLPHTPGSQAAPFAPCASHKQRIQAGRQREGGAGFKPTLDIPARRFAEYDNPVLMSFIAADKGASMPLFNRDIPGSKCGKFANSTAGIEGKAPQRQGANVEPMAVAFIGSGFKVIEKSLQFGASWSAGQELWSGRLFGKLNRIRRQLAPFVKPGQPDFKGFVIALYAAFFQATLFTVEQEGVNRFGRGWEAVASVGAELVKRRLVKKNGFWRFAGFGLQELLNSPINGSEAVRLDKYQEFSGRAGHCLAWILKVTLVPNILS